MRFAYADPPYPGMAHLYKNHPDYAGEVDHKILIERLVAEFPDGWALSTSASTLWCVLPLCPKETRVLAWCQTNPPFFPQDDLTRAWEPTLLWRGRRRQGDYKHDWIVSWKTAAWHHELSGGLFRGMKAEPYLFWLFRCLGCLPGDELVDLFPGSGAVGRAWEKYQRQMQLPMERPPERQLKLG